MPNFSVLARLEEVDLDDVDPDATDLDDLDLDNLDLDDEDLWDILSSLKFSLDPDILSVFFDHMIPFVYHMFLFLINYVQSICYIFLLISFWD